MNFNSSKSNKTGTVFSFCDAPIVQSMGNGKFWQGVQKNPRSAERDGGKELMIHCEIDKYTQIYVALILQNEMILSEYLNAGES